MQRNRKRKLNSIALAFALAFCSFSTTISLAKKGALKTPPDFFTTYDDCAACHNNLSAPNGEDLSIGTSWSSTMMAHAAKDPYWHAGVRRETIDHPTAVAAIEDKCATCHMPMSRFVANQNSQAGQVFNLLPPSPAGTPSPAAGNQEASIFAQEGVSCTVCHQIQTENLGDESSFSGGFSILSDNAADLKKIWGPYEISKGSKRIMSSASGFTPQAAKHIRDAKLCATCHTLYTHALDESGNPSGELPEQVPYLEWLHSDYAGAQSCQECHMAVPDGAHPISSVLGAPREGVAKHSFRGGNVFMLKLLMQFRDRAGVTARPASLARAISETATHLSSEAAGIKIQPLPSQKAGEVLEFSVNIENLAGHKLPTAYPSRRTWIHATVKDQAGTTIFESGALKKDGSIAGNDNDEDGSRFEPHYGEISESSQVQIYEAILADPKDRVTTGLLQAVKYIKDNRILPMGFEKASADKDIGVYGKAAQDNDFDGGQDTVVYTVGLANAKGPFKIQVELWYQSIGFRWARNLAEYRAPEPDAFIELYDAMPGTETAILLTQAQTTVEIPSSSPAADQE